MSDADRPQRRVISLSVPTVVLIVASITAAFVAVTIALASMWWVAKDKSHHDVQFSRQAACRSDLATAVDVAKGPVLLAEGDLLNHIVDSVVNKVDNRAQLTADVAAFNSVRPAYEKALADRSKTAETCGG